MPPEQIGPIEKMHDPLHDQAETWFKNKLETNKPINELIAELDRIVQEDRWPTDYIRQRVDSFNQFFEHQLTQEDMQESNVRPYYEIQSIIGSKGTLKINVRPSNDSVFARFIDSEKEV